MPAIPSRQRSWPGFFGAMIAAILVVAIWFPIRLIAELLKTNDLRDKPDRREESQRLFREAYARSLDLPSPSDFAASVLAHVDPGHPMRAALSDALRQLYSADMMLTVPPIPADLDSLDAIRWRDRLRREIPRMSPQGLVAMRRALLEAIDAASVGLPKLSPEGELAAPLSSLVNPARFVEALAKPLLAGAFPDFAARYDSNTRAISGIPPGKLAKPPKLMQPTDVDDPSRFLGGTPFADILKTPIGVDLPQAARSSHHWIVAGTGAGKTNALHYFLAHDLLRAMRGDCSLIVLDSQHQLIDRIWSLKLFAPDQPLDGKLCLLDAADVEYPLAINLFDMKLDRLASLSMLEREKLTNSALEMYEFIIGSLLNAEMTARQSTLFRFVTRALFAIPGATIHTFHDLLQNGPAKYQSAIDNLDPVARQFFAGDFNSPQFKQTKEQVIARLWAVLGNQTFTRMFEAKRSKIDLFEAINTPGKVILINAEKGLLKEEGTELFGRFFLALINQAAAQRSSLALDKRLPCFVYVDECHNYIRNDPKIQVILAEARQQNIGLVLAHQYLAQIEAPVLRALAGNTAIKMAARLEGAERASMARDMNVSPDFIRDQKVGSFACFIRDETPSAISLRFPFDPLSRFATMSATEKKIVRKRNREAYANPLFPASKTPPKSDVPPSRDGEDSFRNPDAP